MSCIFNRILVSCRYCLMKVLAFAIQVKAFPSSPKNVINESSNIVCKRQNKGDHWQKQQLINNSLQHFNIALHVSNVITN